MLTLAIIAAALLFLTWVGYPLAIHLLARLVPRPDSPVPGTWPAVTVIVATREDPNAATDRVDDILAGNYPRDRLAVVVALDASCGRPAEAYGCGDPRVRVVAGDVPGGKAAALNAGVRAAAGEVLVFTDTHQRFAPDAIRVLAQEVTGGPFGIVSGQLELPEGKQRSLLDWYWRLEGRLRRDEARLFSAVGVSGSVYAMHRGLWEPLPAGLILDDLYVPMRAILAGHRVGFTAAAKAHDARRTEPEQEFRRKVRTLTGNFQLCAWLPAVLVPFRNRAWVQFVLHKLMRLFTPWLFVVMIASGVGALFVRWGWASLAALGGAALLVLLLAQLLGLWHRLVAYARWFFAMQAAVAVATLNGLTGRWDVWKHR